MEICQQTRRKISRLERWILVCYLLCSFGCFHNPFKKQSTVATNTFTELKSKLVGEPVKQDKQETRFVTVPYTKTTMDLPTLSSANISIPSVSFHSAVASILPSIESSNAPPVLHNVQRWFWTLVVACIVAAIVATFTTHFLAAIKFALAAICGAAFNYLYGVVIGSFVLACFASFAAGLVIAYYILNGRYKFSLSNAEQTVNDRLQAIENKVIPK